MKTGMGMGVFSALAALLCCCSTGIVDGGGNSSDIPNGIFLSGQGTVIEGRTRSCATLHLYAQDYIPDTVRAASTPDTVPAAGEDGKWEFSNTGYTDSVIADRNGYFKFERLPQGIYNLIVYDQENGKTLMVDSIRVFPDERDSAALDALLSPGRVEGGLNGTPGFDVAGVYVYLQGTSLWTTTDTGGRFTISPVPPGNVSVRIAYPDHRQVSYTESTQLKVQVVSGETVQVTIGL